jgi:hypothetical protein
LKPVGHLVSQVNTVTNANDIRIFGITPKDLIPNKASDDITGHIERCSGLPDFPEYKKFSFAALYVHAAKLRT